MEREEADSYLLSSGFHESMSFPSPIKQNVKKQNKTPNQKKPNQSRVSSNCSVEKWRQQQM